MLKYLLFIVFTTCPTFCFGSTVTNLHTAYRNGQTFLTWKNLSSDAYYKVYRSTLPVTSGSQLVNCEYLGWTNKNSAVDHNMTMHSGNNLYYHLDSNGIALQPGTGLFVATTSLDGSYFYAVTSILKGTENVQIVAGSNAVMLATTEFVRAPLPVFQNHHPVGNKSVDIYTIFYSTYKVAGMPLESSAGFISLDFALDRNNAGSLLHPLKVLLHPGGNDFLWQLDAFEQNEFILGLETQLPSDAYNGCYGSNQGYDIYKTNDENVVPVSGINYDYIQTIISQTIDWAIKHLPIDSNRIYLKGSSLGAGGAFLYTIAHPDRIAAITLTVPCFNFGFENDYNPMCSFNPGMRNRIDGNVLFGTVSTNLMNNNGIHFYDAANGGWMIHKYVNKNFPVMFALSGKHDAMVGWTEKPIFYDSVKANHTGGYFFWDEREHGGTNSTWDDASFSMFRYASNRSFPAFANCSNDEDYGIGNDVTGAAYGTVNGSLDWEENSITDNLNLWEVKIFVRDLQTSTAKWIVYPAACTVDVTPRRLQYFSVAFGTVYHWTVTHNSSVIQSGSQVYDGGIIVIPSVMVFKDSCILKITNDNGIQLFYKDKDEDGYGNVLDFVEATTPPEGYVVDKTDCNDNNNSIHPGAPDICNSTDDNCNGIMDENSITAFVDPSGSVQLCSGITATLTANNGIGIFYQWYKNGKLISGATNQAYLPNKTTGYYVYETNNFNCSSASAVVNVTILTSPIAKVIPLGDLDICLTGNVVLQANDGIGYTYQWMKGSKILTGATGKNYTASVNANYKVVVTNNAGCSNTSPAVKVLKSCKDGIVSDEGIAMELTCYPNPSIGQFTITFHVNEMKQSPATIEIVNSLNQKVFAEKIQLENGALTKVIGTDRSLSSGIYTISVIAGDHVYTKKVIIQR